MTGQPNDPNDPKTDIDGADAQSPDQSGDAEFNDGDDVADQTQMAGAGYSAAQLRMARRKARRLGLNPSNGKQAIKMLEERGIAIDDKEPNMADSAKLGGGAPASGNAQPPSREAGGLMQNQKGTNLPASQVLGANNPPAVISAEERQLEIARLEKKIKQRRESRMRKLIRRFTLFVILPSVIMGIYFYKIATPLYGANTQMNIESASEASSASRVGSLFSGTALASQSNSISVQDYLNSRAAFIRLQEDYPFSELFMGEDIDYFLRLPEDANEEDRYAIYRKQVKVSYDNTDQVLRMEVRTPTAESALAVSEHLLTYAEDQVDLATQRLRDEGVNDAQTIVDEKLVALDEAKEEIFRIQEEQGTLSPTADQEVLISQKAALQEQLLQQRIILMQLESNPNPVSARVNAVRSEITRLEEMVENLNLEGTQGESGGPSVNRLNQQMLIAESNLAFAQEDYALAQSGLQQAKVEARSQRSYITTPVPPTSSFEPIYPKKLLNTISAFFIFFALYILVSITIEVIREQVSA